MGKIVLVTVEVAVNVPKDRKDSNAWAGEYVYDALKAKNRTREITIKVEEPKDAVATE